MTSSAFRVNLKSQLAAIAAAALLVAAAPAQATTLAFEGLPYGWQAATIANAAPSVAGTFAAGQMQFNKVDGDVTSKLLAYCVDIFQWASYTAQEYNVVSGASYFGATKATDLGRLFAEFDSWNAGTAFTAQESGAMQMAVWEIVNEHDTVNGALQYQLSTGSFTASAPDAGTNALAQSWLNNLSSSNKVYELTVYTNGSFQDYVAINEVPEPATAALMFGALGAMGMLSRRRKVNAS